jgi:MFS family permease
MASLAAPLAYARRDSSLAALFAYQFFFTFAIDAFPIYLPLFAVKLGASQATVGPLVAASWLVYALVQPAGGRLSDRGRGRKRLIGGGLAGMAAAAALLGLAGWAEAPYALPLMAAAWVLMAIPDGLFRPSADALLVDLAPPDERGRFLGALGSAAALANVAAPLVYGVVASRISLGAAFLVASAALLVALAAIGRVREPGRAPAPQLTAPLEAR